MDEKEIIINEILVDRQVIDRKVDDNKIKEMRSGELERECWKGGTNLIGNRMVSDCLSDPQKNSSITYCQCPSLGLCYIALICSLRISSFSCGLGDNYKIVKKESDKTQTVKPLTDDRNPLITNAGIP